MDVIKSRKTSSGSEVEALAHTVRCFYTEYSEYLVLYVTLDGTAGDAPSQPAVVAVRRCGSAVGDAGLVPQSEEMHC